MTSNKRVLALAALLAALLTAACAPSTNQLQAITPLPSGTPVSSPAPTEPATLTPTMAAEPTATSALAALMAQAPTSDGFPTATPLDNNLVAGQAAAIAAATDAAFVPTPRERVAFDLFPVAITFDEFYDGYNIRTGLLLSDELVSLDGQAVIMEGYMAPPLKPELDYFVLTRIRLAFCPFCSTAGDWPDDIALVYMPDGETTVATERPIRVTGRIEVGMSVDEETGMVSLVRLYVDQLEVL